MGTDNAADSLTEEEMLVELLQDGVVFINQPWWLDDIRHDMFGVWVNVNDTFAYASADGEEVLYPELKAIWKAWRRDKIYGPVAFAVAKRRMRPLPQIVVKMTRWNIAELMRGILWLR